ncbi:hypothetical protein SASPL_147197 [Salvia splendens]|uniref:Two-component response regulator n=1 Tax=Salvia splendens TaxID=180675 RepID=A0A8X8Z6A3_SALSN|nr:hypothetical protein SASPL_147197 [Salvia splendens]
MKPTIIRNLVFEVSVTKCSRAEVALQLVRDNMDGFDIVMSDVHMPDMDGFKLLEHIGLEMDLLIMMSADDSKSVVMKGITHGACDYLIKPVRMEALKNIWQHVIRKKKYECKEKDTEHLGSVEEGDDQQHKPTDNADYSSSANEGNWRSLRKREEDEDDGDDKDESSALKKLRVVWTVELHRLFVTAVNQLGIDKAVPKKILQLMNVPCLSRENVASHLQKYRLYLRRIGQQSQNGAGSSFLEHQDAGFGMISSVNGLDPQALASSAHSLGRVTNNSVPIVDQLNIFSINNPNIRFLDGQQHYNHSMQVNPLHGIPTNMDPQQLVALQPFGKMHMNIHSQSGPVIRQLVQPQSRTQMLNQVGGNQLLTHRSSVGPPGLSQAVPGSVFCMYGMDNVRAPTYTPLPQNVGSSQHQGRVDVAPSVLFQPGFASEHRNGHMRNGANLRPSQGESSHSLPTPHIPESSKTVDTSTNDGGASRKRTIEHSTEKPPPAPKKKKRSPYWDHCEKRVEKLSDGSLQVTGICKYCQVEIPCGGGSTSGLINHLVKRCTLCPLYDHSCHEKGHCKGYLCNDKFSLYKDPTDDDLDLYKEIEEIEKNAHMSQDDSQVLSTT